MKKNNNMCENQSVAPLVLSGEPKNRSLQAPARQARVVPGCGHTEQTGRCCEHFSDSALRPRAALVARKTERRHVLCSLPPKNSGSKSNQIVDDRRDLGPSRVSPEPLRRRSPVAVDEPGVVEARTSERSCALTGRAPAVR